MALSPADVRAELIAIGDASAADLSALLRAMRTRTGEEIRDYLLTELPHVTADSQLAAASLAADWYDDLRELAEVPGRFSAIVPEPADDERLATLTRWAVYPLFTATPDVKRTEELLAGGVRKLIADAHRDTVTKSVTSDPKGVGWARYGRGGTCSFCRLLISRGDVYKHDTARFASHTNCSCIAGPVFDPDVSHVDGFTTPPVDTAHGDDDVARARRWVEDNPQS